MDKSRRSILVAGAGVAAVVVAVIGMPSLTAQSKYSEWSAPVNLTDVNSAFNESGPALSKNRLSLYFDSNRPGTLGLGDLWVSRRDSVDELWGPASNLGNVINTAAAEAQPSLSRDGHWLFFASQRTDHSFGGLDIWVSYREHTHDDFDWQAPVNVGAGVNSPSFDQDPFVFESNDLGAAQLFFARTIQGVNRILVSNHLPDGTFGPATLVPELNGTANDRGASVRFDGLEVFFLSTRPGGAGLQDLWTTTRETVFDSWSAPTNLGSLVNSEAGDLAPEIASDRETLYFMSTRAGGLGGQDLYMTTRTRR